jgi:hypothetical protein
LERLADIRAIAGTAVVHVVSTADADQNASRLKQRLTTGYQDRA